MHNYQRFIVVSLLFCVQWETLKSNCSNRKYWARLRQSATICLKSAETEQLIFLRRECFRDFFLFFLLMLWRVVLCIVRLLDATMRYEAIASSSANLYYHFSLLLPQKAHQPICHTLWFCHNLRECRVPNNNWFIWCGRIAGFIQNECVNHFKTLCEVFYKHKMKNHIPHNFCFVKYLAHVRELLNVGMFGCMLKI